MRARSTVLAPGAVWDVPERTTRTTNDASRGAERCHAPGFRGTRADGCLVDRRGRPPGAPPGRAPGNLQDELVAAADWPQPDLQPGDERTALGQRLDHYRAIAAAALVNLQ